MQDYSPMPIGFGDTLTDYLVRVSQLRPILKRGCSGCFHIFQATNASGQLRAVIWAGLLSEVQRPDGVRVLLSYDALARRTRKVVLGAEGQPPTRREVRFVWDGDVPLHEVASSEGLTTWLFEPDSFSPLAREDASGRYAVVTDHLGAPTEMYDELGRLAWRMQLDTFGVGRTDVALKQCPWRWPESHAPRTASRTPAA